MIGVAGSPTCDERPPMASGVAGPRDGGAPARSGSDTDRRVVAPPGELGVETCGPLRTALHEACGAGSDVVVDLSQVTSIDSAALSVLVSAHRRLREAGHALMLADPSARVTRVLRITGLDGLFAR